MIPPADTRWLNTSDVNEDGSKNTCKVYRLGNWRVRLGHNIVFKKRKDGIFSNRQFWKS